MNSCRFISQISSHSTKQTLTLGVLAALTLSISTPSQAVAFGWFGKKHAKAVKATQPVTPPAVDMLDNQCDPIRRRVVKLNSQGSIGRFVSRPHKAKLKSRYYKCIQAFNQQERSYLESIAMPAKADEPSAKPLNIELK